MLSPEQNAAVARWLGKNSGRPKVALLLWQELFTLGSETFRTTLHSIDREFRQPSTTLQVVDGLIVCPPSWQGLDP